MTKIERNKKLMNKKQPIIELKHIKKCYTNNVPVIYDFNLTINEGEFVTFLGPSGCGKTTILRMLAGFETPTDGEILFHGKDISILPPNERKFNTVFQKYALFPHLNIYDNIAFGLKEKKIPKDEIKKKVKRVLEVVDLEGFEKRKIDSLSGGQQQRIAIARAIVNEPKILLLDEPLSALDYKMRQEMQIELKNMHKELGITFIFVTHDQEEALMMSDKIVVMSKGQIQQVGTPEEIYNKPQNAFVADFIGESNIFDGVKKSDDTVHFAHHDFPCEDEYEAGTRVDVIIRPEDVILSSPKDGKFSGEIISCLFCGKFYEVAVQSDKNEIEAHILHEIKPGTKVGIDFTPGTIHTMPKDTKVNHYVGVMEKDGYLKFMDGSIPVPVEKLFDGCRLEHGHIVDQDGHKVHLEGEKVKMFFPSKLANLSDDPEEGYFQGNIISIIYKGDHYNYRIVSENKVEYSVDDEDLWNIGDFVSVVIPDDAMEFQRVSEESK